MLLVLLLFACSDALKGLYLPLVIVELFERPELMSYLWIVQAVFELLFMTVAGYWALRFGSRRVILVAVFCALLTYGVYSVGPPLIIFFLVQPIYSFFVSVLYGVGIGYVQKMFHQKIGFGSSVYVFLLEFAKLIGYILPFIIAGYQSTIFVIPATIMSLGLLLMIGQFMINYRINRDKMII